MARDTKPTAHYVVELADRLKAEYSNQDRLDLAMKRLEQMDQIIAAAKTPDQAMTPGMALRSGLYLQLLGRNAAIVTVDPFIRFNPPDPEDEKDREHSSLLEAWTNSAMKESGFNSVLRERKARSLMGYGRSWDKTYPVPSAWADSDMKEAVDKMASEKLDDAERKAIRKEVEAMKRDRWPIETCFVDPIGTYAVIGTPRNWLPEVVECREMSADEIEAAYGASMVPSGYKKGSRIEVYEYANHFWQAIVIGKKDSKMAFTYEHGLGMSPYVLEETNLLGTNQYGIRWFPIMFHSESMLRAFDTLLSDWFTNSHENALGTIIQKYDREATEEAVGRPEVQEMKPGGAIAMWTTESVELGPVPTLTGEHSALRNFIYNFLEQNTVQPVLSGETKSGDSQTLMVSAIAMAERRFSPAMDAVNRGQEQRARILLRCVQAMNKDYPEDADKIWLYDGFKGKGAIGIGPRDVIGWEKAIQALGKPALPLDEHRKAAVAQIKLALGVPRTVVMEEMGYENPESIIRKGLVEMGETAIIQQVIIPEWIKRAQGAIMQPAPAEMGQLEAMRGQGSPELEMMMGGLGGIGQGASNVARTGVPQAPQQPMMP